MQESQSTKDKEYQQSPSCSHGKAPECSRETDGAAPSLALLEGNCPGGLPGALRRALQHKEVSERTLTDSLLTLLNDPASFSAALESGLFNHLVGSRKWGRVIGDVVSHPKASLLLPSLLRINPDQQVLLPVKVSDNSRGWSRKKEFPNALFLLFSLGHLDLQVIGMLLAHRPCEQLLGANQFGEIALIELMESGCPWGYRFRGPWRCYRRSMEPVLAYCMAALSVQDLEDNGLLDKVFFCACEKGYSWIAKRLISEREHLCTRRVTEDPLERAIHNGHEEIVELFLEKDPHAVIASRPRGLLFAFASKTIPASVFKNRPERLDSLSDTAPSSSIDTSVKESFSRERILSLLHLFLRYSPEEQLLKTDREGCILLHCLVKSRATALIEVVLKYEPEKQVLSRDRKGNIPLDYVLDELKEYDLEYPKILSLLLAHKPEAQSPSLLARGTSLLHVAVKFDLIELAEQALSLHPEERLSLSSEEGHPPLQAPLCTRPETASMAFLSRAIHDLLSYQAMHPNRGELVECPSVAHAFVQIALEGRISVEEFLAVCRGKELTEEVQQALIDRTTKSAKTSVSTL